MRISDWSSDVCSSDLRFGKGLAVFARGGDFSRGRRSLSKCSQGGRNRQRYCRTYADSTSGPTLRGAEKQVVAHMPRPPFSRASAWPAIGAPGPRPSTNVSSAYSSGTFPLMRSKGGTDVRSEEQTAELQSLMRISYAVFCLKKK